MKIVVDLGFMEYTFTNVIAWGSSTELKGFVWINTRQKNGTTKSTYLPEKDIVSLTIGGKKDE